MVAPHGTYSAIVFPLFLERDVVRTLLPRWLKEGVEGDPLLPIPLQDLATMGVPAEQAERVHVVLVQLGWQSNTGIGPQWMCMDFHEFKAEIPYVRHPRWAALAKGTAPRSHAHEPAFNYKLAIGFDLRLLHLAGFVAPGPERCIYAGAGVVEGLRRALCLSQPPTNAQLPRLPTQASPSLSSPKGVYPHASPSLAAYPPEAHSISYTAPGYVSVALTPGPEDRRGWDVVRRLLSQPWFAGATGSMAIEASSIQPLILFLSQFRRPLTFYLLPCDSLHLILGLHMSPAHRIKQTRSCRLKRTTSNREYSCLRFLGQARQLLRLWLSGHVKQGE